MSAFLSTQSTGSSTNPPALPPALLLPICSCLPLVRAGEEHRSPCATVSLDKSRTGDTSPVGWMLRVPTLADKNAHISTCKWEGRAGVGVYIETPRTVRSNSQQGL
jgi:hypothetical protein